MAWQQQTPVVTEGLDFTQLIFRQINSCREADKIPGQFFKEVKKLSNMLVPYWDEEYKEQMDRLKVPMDMSNPYSQYTSEQKDEQAEPVFRELIMLIHRAGFLPEKKIEGVLDERTILAFWKDTGQI